MFGSRDISAQRIVLSGLGISEFTSCKHERVYLHEIGRMLFEVSEDARNVEEIFGEVRTRLKDGMQDQHI